jgi:hypothetical protein
MNKSEEHAFTTVLAMGSGFLLIMILVNVIGALYWNGMDWIVRNWIPDTESAYIMGVMIFGILGVFVLSIRNLIKLNK